MSLPSRASVRRRICLSMPLPSSSSLFASVGAACERGDDHRRVEVVGERVARRGHELLGLGHDRAVAAVVAVRDERRRSCASVVVEVRELAVRRLEAVEPNAGDVPVDVADDLDVEVDRRAVVVLDAEVAQRLAADRLGDLDRS